MEIRRMEEKDLEKVLEIYQKSREFMIENGNPTQWGTDFPSVELVESYVEKDGYVVLQDGEVVGIFALSDYEEVYDDIRGAWLNDEPYGVIHRLASGGSRAGVGQFVLDWCFNKMGNIRIDTHEDNLPLRNLLKKNSYKYCGIVSFGERGERIAFQKSLKKN